MNHLATLESLIREFEKKVKDRNGLLSLVVQIETIAHKLAGEENLKYAILAASYASRIYQIYSQSTEEVKNLLLISKWSLDVALDEVDDRKEYFTTSLNSLENAFRIIDKNQLTIDHSKFISPIFKRLLSLKPSKETEEILQKVLSYEKIVSNRNKLNYRLMECFILQERYREAMNECHEILQSSEMIEDEKNENELKKTLLIWQPILLLQLDDDESLMDETNQKIFDAFTDPMSDHKSNGIYRMNPNLFFLLQTFCTYYVNNEPFVLNNLSHELYHFMNPLQWEMIRRFVAK
ncbi:hypothetical protein SNEBB_011351 [Seison nebaliae]|nr:hypothetical protein SNEBB_011351 [Seison nebaliae]